MIAAAHDAGRRGSPGPRVAVGEPRIRRCRGRRRPRLGRTRPRCHARARAPCRRDGAANIIAPCIHRRSRRGGAGARLRQRAAQIGRARGIWERR
jgi:hypothetical protein